MTGVDCNILVQLAFADHPANSRSIAAVQAEIQLGNKLVIASLVITEFLHVVTDARRFSPPLTMDAALLWTENFLANPGVHIVEATAGSLDQMLDWMRQFGLGRKRILDTHLAAILHTNGVPRLITSNPGDFAIFSVLEIITP